MSHPIQYLIPAYRTISLDTRLSQRPLLNIVLHLFLLACTKQATGAEDAISCSKSSSSSSFRDLVLLFYYYYCYCYCLFFFASYKCRRWYFIPQVFYFLLFLFFLLLLCSFDGIIRGLQVVRASIDGIYFCLFSDNVMLGSNF